MLQNLGSDVEERHYTLREQIPCSINGRSAGAGGIQAACSGSQFTEIAQAQFAVYRSLQGLAVLLLLAKALG